MLKRRALNRWPSNLKLALLCTWSVLIIWNCEPLFHLHYASSHWHWASYSSPVLASAEDYFAVSLLSWSSRSTLCSITCLRSSLAVSHRSAAHVTVLLQEHICHWSSCRPVGLQNPHCTVQFFALHPGSEHIWYRAWTYNGLCRSVLKSLVDSMRDWSPKSFPSLPSNTRTFRWVVLLFLSRADRWFESKNNECNSWWKISRWDKKQNRTDPSKT